MKRKNGFTLIELLAVIVVLAIIALIATPIVMNTIKNSKKGAAERTADNYVEQVETSLMTYRLENGENLPDGEYTIDENGNLTGNGKTLTVEMSGTKPSSGTIVIENGQVKKDGITMTVGDYTVSYDTDNKTFVATEGTGGNTSKYLCTANKEKIIESVKKSDENGIYSSNEEVGLLASEAGYYAYGVTYTCDLGDGERTFFVLEEDNDNVSLIMSSDITYSAWITKEDYLAANGVEEDWQENWGNTSLGPITANNNLKTSTSGWTKLNPNQISLPTYDQIYKAAGNKESNLPTWFEGLEYWTSTPASIRAAYGVYNHSGSIYIGGEGSGTYGGETIREFGIRPVITIPKTELSY